MQGATLKKEMIRSLVTLWRPSPCVPCRDQGSHLDVQANIIVNAVVIHGVKQLNGFQCLFIRG